MKPREKEKEYDKYPTDSFVEAMIENVEYALDVVTDFKDEKTGEPKVVDQVTFTFLIDGFAQPKKYFPLTLSYDEKSTLYKTFISSLVEGAFPYIDFDLDLLKGVKVKLMWKDKATYQVIEMVRPIGPKLLAGPQKAQPKGFDKPKATSKAVAKALEAGDVVVPF